MAPQAAFPFQVKFADGHAIDLQSTVEIQMHREWLAPTYFAKSAGIRLNFTPYGGPDTATVARQRCAEWGQQTRAVRSIDVDIQEADTWSRERN